MISEDMTPAEELAILVKNNTNHNMAREMVIKFQKFYQGVLEEHIRFVEAYNKRANLK